MTPKQSFLNTELWLLTFGGAFQRAKVYNENVSEKQRKQFREALSKYVEENLLQQYQNKVSDEKHIENIHSVTKFSEHYHNILSTGKLNFGVAQKILNLYLKYQWCLGNLQTPPHFPVDRIIQEKMKLKSIISWTKMKDESDYLRIINHARSLVDNGESIAEWELNNFRRNTLS